MAGSNYLCWLASTTFTNKRQQTTPFCETWFQLHYLSTLNTAKVFQVLLADNEHHIDTCQTFGDILRVQHVSHVSTNVAAEQHFF